ncbi:hypothetical protein ACVIWU_002989 [Bradyrhizobium sp. USDA 4509]
MCRAGFSEPSRCGLSSFLQIRLNVCGPSHKPVGSHQHRPQAEPIADLACDIADPPMPAIGKRLQGRAPIKVQQQAATISEQLAELRAAGELEVGRAAARQRMVAAKIVAQRNAPHALGKVGRAV